MSRLCVLIEVFYGIRFVIGRRVFGVLLEWWFCFEKGDMEVVKIGWRLKKEGGSIIICIC